MVQPWIEPGRQQALRSTGALPVVFASFAAVMAIGALVHALATTERRRRHEVAVMQVLGLTRTQARRTVTWHAIIGVLCGAGIGIPVGIALGRMTWEAVARSLPALERSPAAWISAGAVLPVAIAAAIVLSAWPMARTARREPALVLRTE